MKEIFKKNLNLERAFLSIGAGIFTHLLVTKYEGNNTISEKLAEKLDRKEEIAEITQKLDSVNMKGTPNFEVLRDLKRDLSETIFQVLNAKTDIIKSRGEKIALKEEFSDKFKKYINEQFSEVLKAADEIQKFLEDWNNGGKNFLPDISFKDLYQYLDTLTLSQESALLQIIIFILLLLIVSNILAALFGNEIIKYFDLEKKYPKLKIFFSYRAKFQKYSIMWSFFQLFFLCFFGICVNIFIFVY